eukprot:7476543-Pyramimonas_sp.AAC.1
MSCPALAAFEWPEAPDDLHEPIDGWDRWGRTMNAQNTFVPTLETLENARAGAAPWLPIEQDNAMGTTGHSPRGRPPVAWADSFVARPHRVARSVTRRVNLCSDHRLFSGLVQPAAGQTETAGEGNLQVTLDFAPVSGSKAEVIIEGAIDLDQRDGHTYSHCEDVSLNITLTQLEAKAVAAQYLMEYHSFRPGTTDPNILRLPGEMTHEIPEIVRNVIDGNWKVPVSEMQFGFSYNARDRHRS